ncbi:hypothetical protein FOL46_005421 [Perkinsus olseni]|uniref:N-acetyltransferase domain-containing protein n=1 Tax=Perkinsus olseni TaxID=32597 RepID=A0A7J6LSN6_PEROL|nr:hypothetical protein FOL46_005421 [Perkinsus olseni]
MVANRPSRLICLVSALMPATISLTSQQQSSAFIPDVSKLEYRLAEPSDVLITNKVNPTAGLFVAVVPKRNVVVGSAEFGLVANTEGSGEKVFITEGNLREHFMHPGLASKMLKKLLEYIHSERRRVTKAWIRVRRSDEFFTSEVTEAGFQRCGSSDREWLNFCYRFPHSTNKNPVSWIMPKIQAGGSDRLLLDRSRSQKQKGPLTPDPSKLEYRLGEPSDILIADKEYPTAGLFVAVDPKDHVVVGSAEFGLVENESPEEVYITEGKLKKEWELPGLPAKMLKKLLEYIEEKRPQVAMAWTEVERDDKFYTKELKKAGFKRCDSDDFEYRTFCYEFRQKEPPAVGSEPFPVIPTPSDE